MSTNLRWILILQSSNIYYLSNIWQCLDDICCAYLIEIPITTIWRLSSLLWFGTDWTMEFLEYRKIFVGITIFINHTQKINKNNIIANISHITVHETSRGTVKFCNDRKINPLKWPYPSKRYSCKLMELNLCVIKQSIFGKLLWMSIYTDFTKSHITHVYIVLPISRNKQTNKWSNQNLCVQGKNCTVSNICLRSFWTYVSVIANTFNNSFFQWGQVFNIALGLNLKFSSFF